MMKKINHLLVSKNNNTMAKLQCTKCHELTRLSKEEQELLDLGIIEFNNYICEDCVIEEKSNYVDMNELNDSDPGL